MLLSLKPLQNLLIKHAVFDYMQSYKDRIGHLHDQPHTLAREYDPSSWKVLDLGPGKGLSVGFTSEKKTDLAPSTASAVENMTTSKTIHPGIKSDAHPVTSGQSDLNMNTGRWGLSVPKPMPGLQENQQYVNNAFDIPKHNGIIINKGIGIPGRVSNPAPSQPEETGLNSLLKNTSRPLYELYNMWHS